MCCRHNEQFLADNIYAIDGEGTGSGTIEVYNTTLGGAILTWSLPFSAFGNAAVVGRVVRISDNSFCNNTQVSSLRQQQLRQQQLLQRQQQQRQLQKQQQQTQQQHKHHHHAYQQQLHLPEYNH